jgi:hypothetical protein
MECSRFSNGGVVAEYYQAVMPGASIVEDVGCHSAVVAGVV